MKRSIRHVTCALIAALALSACQADTPSGSHGSAPAMSLKIYTVAPAQTQTLRNALHEVLNGDSKVSSPAPGKLLVYAPDRAQASIRQAIDTLEHSDAKAAPRQAVDVHFWVVDGIAGTGKDDAALRGLAPALKPLRQSMGPMYFKLQGTASIVTMVGGSRSELNLANNTVFRAKASHLPGKQIDMHVVFSGPGTVNSGWKPDAGLSSLQTEIAVTPGQYVVLAQSPVAASTSAHTLALLAALAAPSGAASAAANGHGKPAPATSSQFSGAGQQTSTGLRLLVMRVTDTNAAH